MFAAQPVQVTCPQCNQIFTTQVHGIVDVGQNPELKEQLLRGQLNMAQCPFCGSAGALGAPLLYHDPDKALAFVLMPTEMNIPQDEREKIIGSLTNALMSALPAEQRKGYLLQPKTFLTFESLIRAILEADGITSEMLDAQQKRIQLIQELRRRLEDPEQFTSYVEEHRAEIDYELFLFLRAMADAVREDGLTEEADAFDKVREQLLETTGTPAGPSPTEVRVESFDDLLKVLREVEGEELQGLIAGNRAVFDYAFFQQLTSRMEAAQQAGKMDEASELLQLRENVLEATEAVDQATAEALQRASQLLQDILTAEDPYAAAEAQLDTIDEAFLIVLAANVSQAEEQGQIEVAEQLRHLQDFIIDRLEERMPPQVRVINRLLRAETSDERSQVLEAAGDEVNDEIIKVLEAMRDNARAEGQSQITTQLDAVISEVRAYIERQT